MRRLSVASPRLTAREIQEDIGTGDVSLRTVQRAMITAGCKPIKAHMPPYWKKVELGKRAFKMDCWWLAPSNFQRWNVYSGTWQLPKVCSTLWWPFPLQADHYNKTLKHPVQVMVWYCFSYYGTGRADVVEATMNTDSYIQDIINRRVIQ